MMRALLLATLLLVSTARAESVDEADVLRLELAESRVEAKQAQIERDLRDLETLKKAASDERDKLRAKYKIGPGDGIDRSTMTVKRAPAPPPPPKKEPKK